ncbi:unnamed protein product [Ceutorhynchus assimilis]|uniref:HTH psq-type domain-containing protein n=1 Tax=Ceutorhynchus assimilis TaxID=467358 RepID=A0A9N9MPW7_9CUCU|nr:unnamed protein product [Ceutorhynchus assimilis]
MPRKYIRKTDRANIDERVMKSALDECLKNRMKVSEAARQYGVKRTTLQSRIKTLLKRKPLEELLNEDSGNELSEEEKIGNKYTVKQVFTDNSTPPTAPGCSNVTPATPEGGNVALTPPGVEIATPTTPENNNDTSPTPEGKNMEIQTFGYENSQLYFDPNAPSTSGHNTSGSNRRKSSLEMLFPYPKADITKKRVVRRKSKCSIYTDTPELQKREEIEINKKRRQTSVVDKGAKRVVFKKRQIAKRSVGSSSESDVSLDDVNSNSSDDLEDFEPITSSDKFEVGNFVLVKFPGKK